MWNQNKEGAYKEIVEKKNTPDDSRAGRLATVILGIKNDIRRVTFFHAERDIVFDWANVLISYFRVALLIPDCIENLRFLEQFGDCIGARPDNPSVETKVFCGASDFRMAPNDKVVERIDFRTSDVDVFQQIFIWIKIRRRLHIFEHTNLKKVLLGILNWQIEQVFLQVILRVK